MRNFKLRYITIAAMLFSLLAFTGGDEKEKNQILVDIITQGLDRNHYSKVDIDDGFSEKTYKLFIERLDYNKRFLLKSDIDELSYFHDKIDDEIRLRTYMFLNRAIELLDIRTVEVKIIYKDVLSKPFDFALKEDFELDAEKRGYSEDMDEMRNLWRKMLKYQVMSRILDMEREQEKAIEKSDTVEIKSFEVFEEKARKKVLKSHDDWFHRIDQLNYADRRAIFLNSITSSFDPHSTFFPPKDKANFDIAMSGQLEGIGATLTSKEGYITVQRIVPGSASWKQGELEAKDKIIKVAQGEDEAVDIIDMRLDDAVKLIRGPKGTEVRLTVKKIDGSITIIPIVRDVVIIEETYASSMIIENDEKYGYIKLPKFYFDVNKKDARNCFEDIEVEVEKLKNENVDGIVFDLRNNGGGSLQDVVKIAGLFIKEGPVVQVKTRNRPAYIFKDEDSDIQYDGPLVVLVNNFSASASEIFAAAMQDYGRAVIVGSASTFGKGTVQRIINFDSVLPASLDYLKPLGAMKVTMQKFYRINGETTQLEGVIPDIILPDNYSYIEVGEKEMDYPLKYDKIENAEYDLYNNSFPKKLQTLKKLSQSRTDKNQSFKLIDENAKRLKNNRDKTIVSLNFVIFKKVSEQLKEEGENYKDIAKEPTGLNIESLTVDILEIGNDTLKVKRVETMQKDLGKDVYLFEAVEILDDLRKK